LIINKSIAPF